MSVYKKIHQIQAATRSLAANEEGQTGASRYNYVSGSKLLGVIRPLMDKLGLLCTQEVLDIQNTPISYTTRNGEKTEMFTTIHIKFTWIDIEDESSFSNSFYANGMNAWDKGLGSALTYAERYYLMKTFHIATDEDDVDALVKDEAETPVNATKKAPTGKRTAAPAPAPATPPASPARPLDLETYKKIVAAHAKGQKTRDGQDWRQVLLTVYHFNDKDIDKFDGDVENYKFINNI